MYFPPELLIAVKGSIVLSIVAILFLIVIHAKYVTRRNDKPLTTRR